MHKLSKSSKLVQTGGTTEEIKLNNRTQQKGRNTECVFKKPRDPQGARGHTILKIKDKLKEDKLIDKSKPRRTVTRPGRLWAHSGYIGPLALPGFLGKPAVHPCFVYPVLWPCILGCHL